MATTADGSSTDEVTATATRFMTTMTSTGETSLVTSSSTSISDESSPTASSSAMTSSTATSSTMASSTTTSSTMASSTTMAPTTGGMNSTDDMTPTETTSMPSIPITTTTSSTTTIMPTTTTPAVSSTPDPGSSNALAIGLGVTFGGLILLLVVIIVVLWRKHKLPCAKKKSYGASSYLDGDMKGVPLPPTASSPTVVVPPMQIIDENNEEVKDNKLMREKPQDTKEMIPVRDSVTPIMLSGGDGGTSSFVSSFKSENGEVSKPIPLTSLSEENEGGEEVGEGDNRKEGSGEPISQSTPPQEPEEKEQGMVGGEKQEGDEIEGSDDEDYD